MSDITGSDVRRAVKQQIAVEKEILKFIDQFELKSNEDIEWRQVKKGVHKLKEIDPDLFESCLSDYLPFHYGCACRLRKKLYQSYLANKSKRVRALNLIASINAYKKKYGREIIFLRHKEEYFSIPSKYRTVEELNITSAGIFKKTIPLQLTEIPVLRVTTGQDKCDKSSINQLQHFANEIRGLKTPAIITIDSEIFLIALPRDSSITAVSKDYRAEISGLHSAFFSSRRRRPNVKTIFQPIFDRLFPAAYEKGKTVSEACKIIADTFHSKYQYTIAAGSVLTTYWYSSSHHQKRYGRNKYLPLSRNKS